MFGQNSLYTDIPNAVSYEAVFGKRSKIKYLMAVGTIWSSTEGVLLHGDDAKESSSEPAAGNGNPEVWETESDSTTPPMCKPLPSGKIMNVPDTESVLTGDTRHQAEALFDENYDFDHVASYEGDSLVVASEMIDLQAVERILKISNIDVNTVDGNEKTALMIASEQGNVEIVTKIIGHADTDVNKEDSNGIPAFALLLACQNNHLEVVELLLQHPKIGGWHVNYCFFVSCCFRQMLIFKHIVDHSLIDVNRSTAADGGTPLTGACNAGCLEIVEQLLQRNEIEVNKAQNDGQTPLFKACQNGHLEIVAKLLERKEIEVNKARTDIGATPLFVTCDTGHLEIVEKLLERNEIEVNKSKNTGSTPLFMACQKGHLEIVEKLLERSEIEVNKPRDLGWTPLCIGCFFGHVDIVQCLLAQSDINVNVQSTVSWTDGQMANQIEVGTTALMIAAHRGHQEVVEHLLAHPHIQIDQTDDHNNTAMQIAQREGHEEIANLLRDHSTKN